MDFDIKIKEIMTDAVTRVAPTTTIKDIEDIFSEHDFHHLPVVENGLKLVGIISKKDFEKFNRWMSVETTGKTWTNKSLKSITASQIMVKPVQVLSSKDAVKQAVELFLQNKFHAIPIVDFNNLVGMLTTHDILKYCFQTYTEKRSISKVESY